MYEYTYTYVYLGFRFYTQLSFMSSSWQYSGCGNTISICSYQDRVAAYKANTLLLLCPWTKGTCFYFNNQVQHQHF